MYEITRLTRVLRKHTDLCRNINYDNHNDLVAKRQEVASKIKRKLNWTEICKQLPQNVVILLNKIHNLVSKICEGQALEVINDLSLYVIRLLIKEKVPSQNIMTELKQLLGISDKKSLTDLIQIASEIQQIISDENLNLILHWNDHIEDSDLKPEPFGSKIPYYQEQVKWPETDMLHNMSSKKSMDITDKFQELIRVPQTETKIKRTEFDKQQVVKGMKKAFEKYCTVMDYEEFVNVIIEKLKVSDNLSQSELFDLLGYENIDFIEYIIEHHKLILGWYSNLKLTKTFTERQPQISSQVIVHSEKEKQLMKQVRKEEKKLQKAVSKLEKNFDDNDDDNNVDDLFNRTELQSKRQKALLAKAEPILRKNRIGTTTVQENYPFVFDSKLTVKSSAGFVSGKRILLPENITRIDNQLCEQVDIPIQDFESLNVENDLAPTILISTLDEIGQTAFKGVKSLNRIQNIVFDTAYNTNENLLISAPTGAGKTNIALLTIIHQIKLHINDGILKTNEFKIIYIAPMKALAAEMTANFSKRLGPLGIVVRELTGDMQLTKTEIQQTQMIVTTPEKWDVVTRKGTGDIALTRIVKLLIIDEVHLLHGDRGPVVEALVARTLRQVESSQSMIRIVGLSATLPNYVDIARFLRVNPYKGLFYFDHRFRPVPLKQTFIGVKAIKPMQQMSDMDLICYNQVIDMVQKGHQVMVFVHARNATIRTANVIKEMSLQNGTHQSFISEESSKLAQKAFNSSLNKYLSELFIHGLSVHHAGMLRTDRYGCKYF